MTIWTSSAMGWSAGQDITDELANFVSSSLKVGDTLVLEDMYSIKAGVEISLPKNVTLAADYGGGLDITNTGANAKATILLGDGNTVDNVTVTADGTPNSGFQGQKPQVNEDYDPSRAFGIYNSDNVTIVNSSFSGNLAMHFDVRESNGLVIEDTHFEGGFYQVRILGDSRSVDITGAHFKDSLGDGIKTERLDGEGPKNVSISESLFEGNNRDGIDTAGGFKDSYIGNNVFYGNGQAIDFKAMMERPSDVSDGYSSSNILVEGNTIVNSLNAITFSLVDRGNIATLANVDESVVHDVVIKDTVFEMTPDFKHDEMRAIMVKDANNISWSGIELYGGVKIYSEKEGQAPSGYDNYNIGGTVDKTGPSTNPTVDGLWPYEAGPERSGPLLGSDNADDTPILSPAPTPPPVIPPQEEPEVVEEQVTKTEAPSPGMESLRPEIEFSDSDVLLSVRSDLKFDGSSASVVELVSPNALEVSAATVNFTFNAVTVAGSHGLVSKDAKGYDVNESHFTSYIKNGTLYVRFQDDTLSKTFSVSDIKAGKDYDVSASFGDGNVAMWLNGSLVGQDTLDIDWTENEEYLQIGANGWASDSGEAGFRDTFKGTISELTITDGFASKPGLAAAAPVDQVEDEPVTVEPEVVTPEEVDTRTQEPVTSTEDIDSESGSPSSDGDTATVFSMDGPYQFDGSSGRVLEYQHDADMYLEEAIIAFTFEADQLGGRQGLVSKDAKGTDENDGHFTSYLRDDTLFVRFQQDDKSETFEVDGINANQSYDVVTSFGDGVVSMWLDGELIGEHSLDMDWTENEEFLQVGANGWASQSGEAGYRDAFKGTISDVAIFDLDADYAAQFAASIEEEAEEVSDFLLI
ncbi:MAG: hypothetical protein AAFO63_09495 [Pseudomonadota bacterium]